MGEQPAEEEESGRSTLARALKMLRERSGKSLGQLAEDTSYDKSYLCRLESGDRLSKRPVMVDLDAYYRTGDLLVGLWRLAHREVFKVQYKAFMRYEADAVIMHKYMQVMPGLLQTEEYAREVLSAAPGLLSEGEIEEQVAARVGRQELLHRHPAPNTRVILDESVLRRSAADPEVWCGQLKHLVVSAGQPCIVLQVLPFTAGVHDLMGGSLSLLWQADGSAVAYLEGNKFGELIEDAAKVNAYRLSYDQIRDRALSPPDSVAFVERILEEHT
ncbi:MAG: helix-turn-helix domain-containing protein [Streptomyces sp.]|uniref:helix-turn-helix domain-containing protein n=1 Tax=Streptomyces sp. TaxID=1931 RepID=UPI003D6BDC83